MKIYTYYQNINFKNQDELVSLWKKSWEDHKFEAVVLSESDSKKSDLYEEFVDQIQKSCQKIAGKHIEAYELSCWLRWLAYSTQTEEKFFVSDYDIINHSFNQREPEDILHLMDDCCPCFASGTASQFRNLCKKFIDTLKANEESFSQIYKKLGYRSFHDQDFFVMYYYDRKNDKDLMLSRDRSFISSPHDKDFWNRPLVHYSHYGCKHYCVANNIEFSESQRCSIIKEHLNKTI